MQDLEKGRHPRPWGVYIHWPFCLSKCPYCDFNSHVRESIEDDLWGEALVRELETSLSALSTDDSGDSRRLESIFFGGGTPSLMPAIWVERLIHTARAFGNVSDTLEITLESNPTSCDQKKFEAFAKAGVNRLSLGVQALDQEALTFLGREHTTTQAHQALLWAQGIFPRVSFDLIYGLPQQTLTDWRAALTQALERYHPSHMSCYQLTYEPGTAFYTRFLRGELAYPPEDLAVALYEETGRILGIAGLQAYEVSNYALPGHECRHNLVYWQYEDYLGIGPGAHGRLSRRGKRHACYNLKAPEIWRAAVTDKGHGLVADVDLSLREQFEEWLLMGLRLERGVDVDRCHQITGCSWETFCPPQTIAPLVQEGLLMLEHTAACGLTLKASPRGRLVLNQLVARLAG